MLACLAAVACLSAQEEAKDLLASVRDHYASLKRFEARIVHHESSGLFPGDYEQRLVWKGRHDFELTVTKRSAFRPSEGKPGTIAPDYFAKGGTVRARYPDRTERTEPVVPSPNSMPGWEVSGGLALTFLERTPNANIFFHPPQGFAVTFAKGSKTQWKGQDVRELLIRFEAGGSGQTVSLFLEPKRPLIVGGEFLKGWTRYADVRAE
jgi:hypothetical protein